MDGWTTVAREADATYTDRKSVFIAEVRPVRTEDEALAFLEQIKKKSADARHHVYAYILNEHNTSRFSDDGEPHGTAGMPILTLLRRENLSDVVLVVTRYFGGILLGTGGLVRAYTESARMALENAGRQVVEKVVRFSVDCPYSEYAKLESLLSSRGDRIRKEDATFEHSVRMTFLCAEKETPALLRDWTDKTAGKIPMKAEETLFDVLKTDG